MDIINNIFQHIAQHTVVYDRDGGGGMQKINGLFSEKEGCNKGGI